MSSLAQPGGSPDQEPIKPPSVVGTSPAVPASDPRHFESLRPPERGAYSGPFPQALHFFPSAVLVPNLAAAEWNSLTAHVLTLEPGDPQVDLVSAAHVFKASWDHHDALVEELISLTPPDASIGIGLCEELNFSGDSSTATYRLIEVYGMAPAECFPEAYLVEDTTGALTLGFFWDHSDDEPGLLSREQRWDQLTFLKDLHTVSYRTGEIAALNRPVFSDPHPSSHPALVSLCALRDSHEEDTDQPLIEQGRVCALLSRLSDLTGCEVPLPSPEELNISRHDLLTELLEKPRESWCVRGVEGFLVVLSPHSSARSAQDDLTALEIAEIDLRTPHTSLESLDPIEICITHADSAFLVALADLIGIRMSRASAERLLDFIDGEPSPAPEDLAIEPRHSSHSVRVRTERRFTLAHGEALEMLEEDPSLAEEEEDGESLVEINWQQENEADDANDSVELIASFRSVEISLSESRLPREGLCMTVFMEDESPHVMLGRYHAGVVRPLSRECVDAVIALAGEPPLSECNVSLEMGIPESGSRTAQVGDRVFIEFAPQRRDE